jgi:hypothetical protein
LFTRGISVTVTTGGTTAIKEFADLPAPPPKTGPITSISLTNYFDTGFSGSNSPLTVPLIDPAGVVYYPLSESLVIVDSEINEVPAAFSTVQANLLSTDTEGSTVLGKWDLTQLGQNEPTGIAYCTNDAHFYIANDDFKTITRYSYDGAQFVVVDKFYTFPVPPKPDAVAYQNDPEGITCDPDTGRLYVVGGVDPSILVLRYDNGFVVEDFFSLPVTAGDSAGVPTDAEGIAFDSGSGHLYLVSGSENKILAYTTTGQWLTTFSIDDFSPQPINAQGLSVGPSSDNPYTSSFYIADGLVDNDSDTGAGNGRIYEARIYRD